MRDHDRRRKAYFFLDINGDELSTLNFMNANFHFDLWPRVQHYYIRSRPSVPISLVPPFHFTFQAVLVICDSDTQKFGNPSKCTNLTEENIPVWSYRYVYSSDFLMNK